MEKFTRFQKKGFELPQSKELFKGNVLSIVSYDGWEMTSEKDMVLILPYFKDRNTVLLRNEYIPTYRYRKLKDENQDIKHYITVICGTMETGETPENTIRRELYEEAGVVLSSVKEIEIDRVLHLSKGNSAKYHCCLIEISEGEYKQTIARGDGSKAEKLSKTIEVKVEDLDEIIPYDIATSNMILLFKTKFNTEL